MSLYARLRAWLLCRPPPQGEKSAHSAQSKLPSKSRPKVLVVVEGPHDIEFLRRISAILRVEDPSLPDLAAMERRGELVFVPFGGGDLWLWATRLAGLCCAEFHLYDRETSPETELRQQVADVVNLRPQCRAVLTRKRSLENYLHPSAIREVSGISLDCSDDDLVADLLAERRYAHQGDEAPWAELTRQVRKRRRNRAKRLLNTRVADRMTPQRLAERDPDGEVISWLQIIARLAEGMQ